MSYPHRHHVVAAHHNVVEANNLTNNAILRVITFFNLIRMNKTKKDKAKSVTPVEKVGTWVVVFAILIGLASYVHNQIPRSMAATIEPKIKFLSPANTEDVDMSSKYLVKATITGAGPNSLTVDFKVKDSDYHVALLKRVVVPAGARTISFPWNVGYDQAGSRLQWLPKNRVFLTAQIVGDWQIFDSGEFNVVPADLGDGKPIIYLVDPATGWTQGKTTAWVHGRNLLGKNQQTSVWFADKPATMATGSAQTSRRLKVKTPAYQREPLLVDVKVINDRGEAIMKNAFEYIPMV